MGQQIIKQPNGNYAVWSTIVDDFVILDATPEWIIEIWIEDETKRIREDVKKIIEQLNNGKKPYYQFTMGWKEALKWRDMRHGKKDRDFDDQGRFRAQRRKKKKGSK